MSGGSVGRNCTTAQEAVGAETIVCLGRRANTTSAGPPTMQQKVAASSPTSMTREELLARAEALVPVLAERSAEAERLRRCPDSTIADLVDNGLTRICQPRQFGGFELGYDVLCEVSQTLARGCGSQA